MRSFTEEEAQKSDRLNATLTGGSRWKETASAATRISSPVPDGPHEELDLGPRPGVVPNLFVSSVGNRYPEMPGGRTSAQCDLGGTLLPAISKQSAWWAANRMTSRRVLPPLPPVPLRAARGSGPPWFPRTG